MMRTGKLSPDELREYVLGAIKKRRPETVLSAAFGEDAAAVRADDLIFLAVDPITASKNCAKNIGALAIYVSCNDISSGGAEPIAALLTVLMPPDESPETAGEVLRSAEQAAIRENIDIIGGHTEFTDAVTRVVVCATAVGRASKLVKTGTAQAGDYIVMTKSAAIEGTYALVTDFYDRLRLNVEEQAQALKYIDMLSVGAEGRLLRNENISAMHDATEGGIIGAVCELCGASGKGAVINADSVTVSDITKKICVQAGIDPLRLLASGSMLFTAKAPEQIIGKLKDIGIPAAVIGYITPETPIILKRGGSRTEVFQEPDAITSMYK